MNNLLKNWSECANRIARAPHICVLAEYDGALTPITPLPEAAEMSDGMRQVLKRLGRQDGTSAGVFSGRTLDELVGRVGVPGLWYVGNHGFELCAPDGKTRRLYRDEDARMMASVTHELTEATGGIPGVAIEHKGPTLALHYRLVSPRRAPLVRSRFARVILRHRNRVIGQRGRRALEARVRAAADKGTALDQIRRKLPRRTTIFYFGDDLSDKPAWRAIEGSGIRVRVGASRVGPVDYTLEGPDEVLETLRRIDALRP